MSRYADIDKAMELAAKTMVNGTQVAYVVMGLANFVENVLNNAEVEVEPIVRCGECKYGDLCSIKEAENFKDNDFCSRGKRKDEVKP